MKRARAADTEVTARDRNRGTTNFVAVDEGRVPFAPGVDATAASAGGGAEAAVSSSQGGVCEIGRDGVLPGPEWVKLDEALRLIWPELYGSTTSSARKAIRRRGILVAGTTVGSCSHAVLPGTLVERMERAGATSHERAASSRDSEAAPRVAVVYEDDHHAVVYKPRGMTCDSGALRGHGTVSSALLVSLQPCLQVGALARPKHAHRLDLPTEGLLLCAKTRVALAALNEAFSGRRIHKRYRALVFGTPEEAGGVFDTPMYDKPSRTEWRKLDSVPSARFGSVSRVDLWPVTGRKHQLRKHLSAARHPIMGDDSYGFASKVLHGRGLFLAAVELEYPHPVTGEMRRVKVDEPERFGTLMREEAEAYATSDPATRFDPGDAPTLLRLGSHMKHADGPVQEGAEAGSASGSEGDVQD